MKYLIISDIHSNMDALGAVMLETMSMDIDKYIILGDIVGYGANPNEAIGRIRQMNPVAIIRGNHDKVACGLENGDDFNYMAKNAALWTQANLTPESMDFIKRLPKGPVIVDGSSEIVHGSHYDEDQYILGASDALFEFYKSKWKIAFFGHTHVQLVWTYDEDKKEAKSSFPEVGDDGRFEYRLEEDKRYLINPGSVGQPRDRDPRSAFAIFDSDNAIITFFRINYNIKSAQEKIIKAGLDDFLAERLAIGR
jgi:predicted phosphodiesterase